MVIRASLQHIAFVLARFAKNREARYGAKQGGCIHVADRMSSPVQPTLPSGFRDFLPEEAAARLRMLDIIRGVFSRFGFVPLVTSSVERREVLTGGAATFPMIVYEAQTSASRAAGNEPDAALRFDLTVPLARVVAANPDLGRPFKRYQIGSVWRGERAQAGRYREFTQCDVDVVGSSAPAADAEVISCVAAAFTELGVPAFTIRVNSRMLLNAIMQSASVPDEAVDDVLRIIDKLSKIGRDGVCRELAKPRSEGGERQEGDDARESDFGAGLNDEQVAALDAFFAIPTGRDETLASIRAAGGEVVEKACAQLEEIGAALRAFGVSDAQWVFDATVARGLAYYTGMVFETFLDDLPTIGSVCSGGRYDDLVARFTGQSLPATGASIGVDRLFAALEQLGALERSSAGADVLVCMLDDEGSTVALQATRELRDAGIATSVWLGPAGSPGMQLGYAASAGMRVAVLIGEEERSKGAVSIRNLADRSQETVASALLVEAVKGILA
jgi:histidyl-tRNA synthetase